MNKLTDFLAGLQVVEERYSKINSKIQVVKSLAFGTYVQVGGLTQTGGVVNNVWKTSLTKIKKLRNKEIKNCLILGLGGGGNAGIVRRFWSEATITGVDIDPVMVEMGKKYFHLDSLEIEIVIEDAEVFLKSYISRRRRFFNLKSYDLVLVDLYIGDVFPKKFETENYIQLVRTVLTSGGVAVFNRLYFGEKRGDAMRFLHKLEKLFTKVEVVYPEANIMFVCFN